MYCCDSVGSLIQSSGRKKDIPDILLKSRLMEEGVAALQSCTPCAIFLWWPNGELLLWRQLGLIYESVSGACENEQRCKSHYEKA